MQFFEDAPALMAALARSAAASEACTGRIANNINRTVFWPSAFGISAATFTPRFRPKHGQNVAWHCRGETATLPVKTANKGGTC